MDVTRLKWVSSESVFLLIFQFKKLALRDAAVREYGSLDIYLAKQLDSKAMIQTDVSSANLPAVFGFVPQEKQIALFKFVEQAFPATDGMSWAEVVWQKNINKTCCFFKCFLSTRTYCRESDLAHEGAVFLRPWMLPWRMDYGLRGTSDVVPRLPILIFLISMFSIWLISMDFMSIHPINSTHPIIINPSCPGRMSNGVWCNLCAIKV